MISRKEHLQVVAVVTRGLRRSPSNFVAIICQKESGRSLNDRAFDRTIIVYIPHRQFDREATKFSSLEAKVHGKQSTVDANDVVRSRNR